LSRRRQLECRSSTDIQHPNRQLRINRGRHRPSSQWHLDETGVLIGGERFWLWRAVDDEGEVSIFWSNDNVTRTRL